MRGTIHLLPATLLPAWTAALGQREQWRRPAWLKWFGTSLEEMESLIDAMPELLSEEPQTRLELAEALEARLGRHLREVLLSSWGSFLKIPANRGDLAFGPDRGRNVTFVRPAAWLKSWRDVDPQAALDDLVLAYLRAYGPADIDRRPDVARSRRRERPAVADAASPTASPSWSSGHIAASSRAITWTSSGARSRRAASSSLAASTSS